MDLLRNYPAGYNVLPTANPHDVVNITLQLALYHIVDMNERAQTLTTNCEIITKWHDVTIAHYYWPHLLMVITSGLPDVEPRGLRQHPGHSAALGAGLDAGRCAVQRCWGRGARQGDEDSDPGGLPGQRHSPHPGHLHEQVQDGRHLLSFRCANLRAEIRLLVDRSLEGEI